MTRISPELLQRFDVQGPRYTSYPTADRFVEAFTADDYAQALRQRGAQASTLPLSVYVHLPFCASLCYYCACNKIITRHHSRASDYLDLLHKELDLQVAELGRGQTVSQLHLGGGTPTFLSDAELARLMAMLRGAFEQAALALIVQGENILRAGLKRQLAGPAKVARAAHQHHWFGIAQKVL